MLHFQEEVCPIKFLAGEWTFEALGSKGKYEMITWPEGNMYQLTYPNGQQDKGIIDDLFKIKNKLRCYEHGLIQWVYQVVHWCQDEQHRQKYTFEKTEFVFGKRVYHFEFCVRNEEIKLTIPGVAMVVKRSVMSEVCPEIYSMEGGMLSQVLHNIVIEAHKELGEDSLSSEYKEITVSTPLIFEKPEEILIGNNRYFVQYQKETDLLFMQSETRHIKTYLAALDAYLPEINDMHSGELALKIHAFAAEVRAKKFQAEQTQNQ